MTEAPTRREYLANHDITHHEILREYGSWNAFVEAHDFDPRPTRISKDELRADIKQSGAKTVREYRENGRFSYRTVLNRFGSWAAAFEHRSMPDLEDEPMTDFHLAYEYNRAIKGNGVKPSVREWRESETNTSPYEIKKELAVDSWDDAVEILRAKHDSLKDRYPDLR